MAYTAWSVVYGEQPTAAKWNQLGANDAGFKDGTNIDNLAITAAKLAQGAVIPEKLDFSTMGFLVTAASANFGTTAVDLASASVVIPAGCTQVLVIAMVRLQSQNGATQDIQAWLDYNAATLVSKPAIYTSVGTTFAGSTCAIVDRMAVTAGTRTFKLRALTSSGGVANSGGANVMIIPIKA